MSKKLLVVLTVSLAALAMAFGPNKPFLREAVWQNLPDVEITAKVVAFGFYEGRFFTKVASGTEEYYVFLPLALFRDRDFEIELGAELTVTGKKLEYDGKLLIVPTKITYAGRTIDIVRAVRARMAARMRMMHHFPEKPQRPGMPMMPRGRGF